MEKEVNCKTYSESVSCSVCLQVFESSRIYIYIWVLLGLRLSCSRLQFISLWEFTGLLSTFANRPISMCNVIYKIVSKVIANHVKPLLDSLVSETQSAFVANRLIIDNILIAFESLHHMKNNCSGKQGYIALKLDISKAYDRVKWAFLE